MVRMPAQTRFGPPLFVCIFYFLSGGLVFATGMQSSKLIHDPSIGFVGWLAIMAFFSSLGLIGWPVSRLYQKRQQRLRDQRAATVLSETKAGEQCEYSLYLRGFATTGKLPLISAHHDFELRGVQSRF